MDASRTGVLLIRNAFDPNWEATIDGVPATVFPADYVLQGVEVPAGNHVVELRYVDPWIGRGIAGSLLSVAGLLVAAGVLEARRRRSAAQADEHRPTAHERAGERSPAPAGERAPVASEAQVEGEDHEPHGTSPGARAVGPRTGGRLQSG